MAGDEGSADTDDWLPSDLSSSVVTGERDAGVGGGGGCCTTVLVVDNIRGEDGRCGGGVGDLVIWGGGRVEVVFGCGGTVAVDWNGRTTTESE